MTRRAEWPADKVERRPVSGLLPYARNPRTHNETQIAQIAASIKEFGFTNPILIDEDSTIIAGHGRVLAAQLLGITDAPVMVATGWTEAQRRAYVIADNKLAMNAGWDDALLALELTDLEAMSFDTALTGFDQTEIDALKAKAEAHEGLTDPDAVPDPPDEPIAKLGDVWRLGRHTLVCGDCTDADTVAKCLGDVKPHLMCTDPPYGVEYDAEWRMRAGINGPTAAHGKVENDDKADWREAWVLFPGDVAYVWSAPGALQVSSYDSLLAADFDVRQQIIWAKSQFVMGRGHYHYQHEPCWYAVRKGGTGHWGGDRKQATVWNIDKPMKSETGHSTQKPVECMKRPIENNSSPGQAVYDPFVGSGTTLIACEMTGRACHAIELSPTYVDVVCKRFEDFTGTKATLDAPAI